MESKKKNVSLRLSQQDIDRIALLSERFEVKESDVMRFAIKQVLAKLAPFQDESFTGVDLIPALIEEAEGLIGFFEFGGDDLDAIVNRGVTDSGRKIDKEDLSLLAVASLNPDYARIKLSNGDAQAEGKCGDVKEYILSKYIRGLQNTRKQIRRPELSKLIPKTA